MPSSYYPDDRRSDYDDRDRKRSHRPRSPAAYEEEEIIEARRRPKGSGDKSLVPRGRDRDDESDSVEEIPRGHIPGRRGDDYPPRRARSARDKKSRRYDDYSSESESPPRRRRDDRRRELHELI